MGLDTDERVQLRDILLRHFSADEIEDLLFDLNLSADDLRHETRPQLVRSLIEECEHKAILGCLIEKVVEKRPGSGTEGLLAKVEPCHPDHVKVQVILPPGQKLNVSKEEFMRRLVSCFERPPDEVALIGVAGYGERALVSVPALAAAADAPASVQPYDTLDALDQRTWRVGYKQGVWRPSIQLPSRLPGRKGVAGRLLLFVIAAIGLFLFVSLSLVISLSGPGFGPTPTSTTTAGPTVTPVTPTVTPPQELIYLAPSVWILLAVFAAGVLWAGIVAISRRRAKPPIQEPIDTVQPELAQPSLQPDTSWESARDIVQRSGRG